jgi:hypothetical protein
VSVGGGVAHKSQAPNANKKNLDSRPNVLRLSNVNGDDACDWCKGSLFGSKTTGVLLS